MPIAHRPLRRDLRWRPTLQLLEDRTTPAALAGLGAASSFAVLDINSGNLSIVGSSLVGNIGVGPHSSGSLQRDTVTGAVDEAPSANFHPHLGGRDNISGGVVAENLNSAQSDANAASAAYAALKPTKTLKNVTTSTALTGNGGTNVVSVTSVDLNHKTLTLNGGANDLFIFNVAGNFTFNQSKIVLTGGVTANHVIFNFTHANSTVSLTNSANGVNGTFLNPHGTLNYAGSSGFQGELVAKNIQIRASAPLTAAGFSPAASGASLAGFVYEDDDYSGTRDPGESGISGVTIALTGTDAQGNSVSLTTVTASDGSYAFASLGAGTYQLTEQLPSYYFKGTNGVGTVGGTSDGVLDVNGSSIDSIVLSSGNVGVEYDFAVVPPPA